MQRKVTIEFINQQRIEIITWLKTKEFSLIELMKKNIAINLFTLETYIIGSSLYPPRFKTELLGGTGKIYDPFLLHVLAITAADGWYELIGTVGIKDRSKTFCINFPEEK